MAMIQFAINSKQNRQMTLKEIYNWIEDHFPYFRNVAKPGWKVSYTKNQKHFYSNSNVRFLNVFFVLRIPYVTISRCMTCLCVRRLPMERSLIGLFPRKQTAVSPWIKFTRFVLCLWTSSLNILNIQPLQFTSWGFAQVKSLCLLKILQICLICWLTPQPLVDPMAPSFPKTTQVVYQQVRPLLIF